MEKDVFRIPGNPVYVFNKYITRNVKEYNYFKRRDVIAKKEFGEFIVVKEPMIFDNKAIECFAHVPCFPLLNGTKTNDGTSYLIEKRLLEVQNFFPILMTLSYCEDDFLKRIRGKELYDFLDKIKDSNSTINTPTFNRHTDTINLLYSNAYRNTGLPYRSFDDEKRKIDDDKQRENEAEKHAIHILNRFQK